MQELNEVSETALITIRSRVIESQKTNPVLEDPMGEECFTKLLDSLPPDLHERIMERRLSPVLTRHLALRARKYDDLCREFLKEFPDGLIVNLGCGFDTRFWRIGVKGSGYMEVDLPVVIQLKQDILGEKMFYRTIAGSVLEKEWISTVQSQQSNRILFLAEGLFMYFPEDQSIQVLRNIAESFHNSRLVIEVVHMKYTRGFRKKMVEQKMRRKTGTTAGDYFLYGIKQASDLETYHPDIKIHGEWSYLEDPDIKPAVLKLFKHVKSFTRTQYTVIADIL